MKGDLPYPGCDRAPLTDLKEQQINIWMYRYCSQSGDIKRSKYYSGRKWTEEKKSTAMKKYAEMEQ